MDITFKVLQIGYGMVTVSGRLVIIKDDRRLTIVSGPVEPHVRLGLWLLALFL